MKSAAFNDRCSKCGDVIPDNAGCIQVRDYLCDDCCKAAGHQHPWHQKAQGKKEQTVMKQWISPYYFGTRVIDGVMRLVRKVTAASQEEIVPDEDLVALDERGRARVGAHRKGTISRADVSNPDPTIANVAASLEPGEEVCIYATTDMKTGRPLVTSRPESRFASLLEQAKAFLNTAAATVGEARTRALAECNRLRAKIAAESAPPIQVEPETFVAKTCIYPGCGQKFENSGARMMCNDHVHRPKPDLQPDPKAVLAPVAFRLQKPLGRPTEAGPDSNPSRGDTLSHFVPEVSPLQQARDAYAEGLAIGDSEACSEATERITRLTRAAAAPSPGMLKRIVPDSFAGLSGDAGLLQRGKPFVERTCDRCGGDFQTRSDRKTCDACLSKPRPTVYY